MEIGDKFTKEEVLKIGKKYYSRVGSDFQGYYVFNDDLRFEKNEEGEWVFVSSLKHRIENQDSSPKIHRDESKKFKSYYDNRKY